MATESLEAVTLIGQSRDRMLPLAAGIATLAPRRVILNPGAEDSKVVEALLAKGVPVQLACTMVLLDEGRFDDLAVS
ncbi:MAG: hypothetical protein EA417_08750 [Gammaproteobacteria bacterium]|nr:MAG: hypothetical protein EA417_08750 [Gammaproteobacteria bacterium]